jgi:hypothetical protein
MEIMPTTVCDICKITVSLTINYSLTACTALRPASIARISSREMENSGAAGPDCIHDITVFRKSKERFSIPADRRLQ